MIRPNAHSAYLAPQRSPGDIGIWEQANRAVDAAEGSARLLDALLRFFEKRKQAA